MGLSYLDIYFENMKLLPHLTQHREKKPMD